MSDGEVAIVIDKNTFFGENMYVQNHNIGPLSYQNWTILPIATPCFKSTATIKKSSTINIVSYAESTFQNFKDTSPVNPFFTSVHM
jgi:hypothetical protein